MRALSFTQPWLEAILGFGKRIENRPFWRHGCSYLGPVLLHAAKSVGTREDFNATWETICDIVKPGPTMSRRIAVMRVSGHPHAEGWWVPAESLVRGAIVGRARIVGTLSKEAELAVYCAYAGDGDAQRAWWGGGFALVLDDVERIETPIPYKGALGLFEVPDGVLVGANFRASRTDFQALRR